VGILVVRVIVLVVLYRRVLESLFGDAARTSGPISAHKFNPAPRGTQLIIAAVSK